MFTGSVGQGGRGRGNVRARAPVMSMARHIDTSAKTRLKKEGGNARVRAPVMSMARYIDASAKTRWKTEGGNARARARTGHEHGEVHRREREDQVEEGVVVGDRRQVLRHLRGSFRLIGAARRARHAGLAVEPRRRAGLRLRVGFQRFP